ncbi:VIT1/CCC1 transporter family protein [Adhaeretor mobilis]|uniref:VIT family protein n=1 Tax=Adhaeretor mobilis TaxID=1930276 RepID=A0A517MZG4_9BACT|nr:VIT1/CCC1 transporter family protein [Adhaeretor mobilis]QDT00255.1 VIT family protein [Adhaeretor mobilis]
MVPSTTAPGSDDLAASHTPELIHERLAAPATHSYLRDFVYGAIDGAVTTFAVVSGVAGAGLSTGVIIVLGLANLVGDGFSMAASNYLGTKTEEELRRKARRVEESHITDYPEGEREEIRQIFAIKGFEGDQLEGVVDVITADRKRWVDTMLVEELGLPLEGPSALRAAIMTFIAFIVVGLIPLLAFIFNSVSSVEIANPYAASTLLTAFAFFLVGASKSWFVDQSWYRAGIETLAIGGGAAVLAYGVGLLLGGIA